MARWPRCCGGTATTSVRWTRPSSCEKQKGPSSERGSTAWKSRLEPSNVRCDQLMGVLDAFGLFSFVQGFFGGVSLWELNTPRCLEADNHWRKWSLSSKGFRSLGPTRVLTGRWDQGSSTLACTMDENPKPQHLRNIELFGAKKGLLRDRPHKLPSCTIIYRCLLLLLT